jgi:signal transduction histidine kinase
MDASHHSELRQARAPKHGEWRKAEQTALEALATDDTEPANTLSLYENLAKTYAHLGNAAKADEYIDMMQELQASWSNKHYQSAIREMETKYETEKKETQIATLESEKKTMIWLSVAGGAVLLLTLTAFFFLWRWTVQKEKLAESQIKQLEQEKQLIATQAVLDGEVHDGLGSMLTGARMSIESLKNDALRGKTDIANFDSALKILNDSSHELRRIAHHLMPDTLSRFGLKISVGDFCDSLSAVKFLWYGDETRLNPKMEEMIYRTVHELVNNALKHARASQVLVQIIQEPNRLAFTVQDDGDGFDPETVSEGMGLQNIRTRVASFGGMMNIASKAGVGTEINVELRVESGELRVESGE